jgi:hypothetical protein
VNESKVIHITGPVLRAVVRMQLNDDRGHATPPRPMGEYGGLQKVPAGSIVRLDIGRAYMFYPPYGDYMAPALIDAAEIDVIGTDPRGVRAVRDGLAAAIARAQRRRAG